MKDIVMSAILGRKSIRKFSEERVSEEDILAMLRAAMAAPSAMNWQPWRFVVVDSRESLDAMAALNEHGHMLSYAPVAIVVCGVTEWEYDGRKCHNVYWEQDCAAATENLLLAAHACGLGACWNGCWPRAERVAPLKELLGIPDGVEPFSVIPVGHPLSDKAAKDKWNADNIHWGRW